MKMGMRMKIVPLPTEVAASTSLSRPHLLAAFSRYHYCRGFRFRRYHRDQSRTTVDSAAPRASFDTLRRDRCHPWNLKYIRLLSYD